MSTLAPLFAGAVHDRAVIHVQQIEDDVAGRPPPHGGGHLARPCRLLAPEHPLEAGLALVEDDDLPVDDGAGGKVTEAFELGIAFLLRPLPAVLQAEAGFIPVADGPGAVPLDLVEEIRRVERLPQLREHR